MTHVINLVDEYGSPAQDNESHKAHQRSIIIGEAGNTIYKKGQVQIDTDEVLYNDAFDETCTVSTASLINPDAERKEQYLYEKRIAEQCEMEGIKEVTDDVMKVHGITPRKKGEGVTRVIYENPNGFNS